MIDLILKDIEDRYTRENFFRLSRFIRDQVIFDGNFEFFEVTIDKATDPFILPHGLPFIPEDIILLQARGDYNFYFKFQEFDRTNLYIKTGGPVVLRFLAGRLTRGQGKPVPDSFPFVAPGTGAGAPPSGSAPRLIATFNTDVGTLVGDLVVVSGANTVTKIVNNSSASIPNGIFGVGYTKPTATTIEVIFVGIVGGYAGFTAGDPVFVSTSGTPTHTIPATGTVQQIGFAVSTTEFFLQMMQPMRRA